MHISDFDNAISVTIGKSKVEWTIVDRSAGWLELSHQAPGKRSVSRTVHTADLSRLTIVAMDTVELARTNVTTDDGENVWTAESIDALTSGGLIRPWFTTAEADRIADWFESEPNDDPTHISYDSVNDRFVESYFSPTDRVVESPVPVKVTDDGLRLHGIGSVSWVWTVIGRVPTAADIVAAIAQSKKEILADIAAGVVPSDVPDFSALHDYVDANCYAGFCDDDNPLDWITERSDDAGNKVQGAVSAWLRAGRREQLAGEPTEVVEVPVPGIAQVDRKWRLYVVPVADGFRVEQWEPTSKDVYGDPVDVRTGFSETFSTSAEARERANRLIAAAVK
jgi:hypothetical protein